MARIQRGTGKTGEAWKLISMFYSYSSAFYQRQAAFVNDAADAVREREVDVVSPEEEVHDQSASIAFQSPRIPATMGMLDAGAIHLG